MLIYKEHRSLNTKPTLSLALLKTIAVCVFACFLFSSQNLYSQSKKQLEDNKRKIEREIEFANRMLREAKRSQQVTMNQVLIINNKISMRERLISVISMEVYDLDRQIKESAQIIQSLNDDLEKLKAEYAKMIYHAWKIKGQEDLLLFILSADNFNQAYARLKYMQHYSEYRRKQADLIEKTRAMIQIKVAELEEAKKKKQQLLSSSEREKLQLAKEKEDQSKNIEKLKQEERKILQEIRDKQEAARKLQAAIEELIRKEIEASKAKTPSGIYALTPEEQKLAAGFRDNKGRLPWPTVTGMITGHFGERQHPVLKNVKINNNGIDIGTTKGASARAVFSGKVTGVISIPGGGKAVIVRHGNYLTVYSNLETTSVKQGDNIEVRQTIGSILTNPDDGKTELHFEIWEEQNKHNPEFWLSPR